jgi:hypothetical protein
MPVDEIRPLAQVHAIAHRLLCSECGNGEGEWCLAGPQTHHLARYTRAHTSGLISDREYGLVVSGTWPIAYSTSVVRVEVMAATA